MTSRDFGLLDPLGRESRSGELVGDEVWLHAMVDVEIALLRALLEAKLIPTELDDVVTAFALDANLDLTSIASGARGGGNPIIPLVRQLGARAEEIHAGASDWVHLGATSQDIIDTAAMLVARRSIGEVREQLRQLCAELSTLMTAHRSTPMPGRTLGQHASPTSFGLVVAGWLNGILGALERLNAVDDLLPLSFGGSVGNLGVLVEIARRRWPEEDAERVAAAVVESLSHNLSLRNPVAPWHTNRVPIVELGSALAEVVGAIGAMAIDVAMLARTEVAEVSERRGGGAGKSSTMPHKRNPVTAILLIAAARESPGLVATLFSAQVAEDQRPSGAWHSEWSALRQLEKLCIDSATAAASLAGRLEVDATRMRSNLELTNGLIYSERASVILAEALGKSAAFQLVEDCARVTSETGQSLLEVLAQRLADENQDAALVVQVQTAFDADTNLGAANIVIDRVLAQAEEQA